MRPLRPANVRDFIYGVGEDINSPWAHISDDLSPSPSPSPVYELLDCPALPSTQSCPRHEYLPMTRSEATGRPRASTPMVPPLYLKGMKGLDGVVQNSYPGGTGTGDHSIPPGTGGAVYPALPALGDGYKKEELKTFSGNNRKRSLCSSLSCTQQRYESV